MPDATKPALGGFCFASCLGRGNLNRDLNKLIYKINIRFDFLLEYLLEYLHQRLMRIGLAEVMLPVELSASCGGGRFAWGACL